MLDPFRELKLIKAAFSRATFICYNINICKYDTYEVYMKLRKARRMKILVIDAHGGGIGRQIVSKLTEKIPESDIIAVGTNSIATNEMIKSGAKRAATGENAIRFCASEADIITGPIGIMTANAMLGEISPVIAESVGGSKALKVLVPTSHCNVVIAGTDNVPVKESIDEAVNKIIEIYNK